MSTAWIAPPPVDDATVAASTGRGWDEWVALVDAGPGPGAGHTVIARWLVDAHGVDGWWAQSVTVGYERIRGLRLPGQMPDGTFSVSRTRTVRVHPDVLRAILLDDGRRAELLGEVRTVLVSRPDAKSLRFRASYDGAVIGIVAFTAAAADESSKLTVTHEKLPGPDEAAHWKAYWGSWLDGVGTSR